MQIPWRTTIIVSCLLIALTTGAAWADSVYVKDGRKLDGTVIKRDKVVTIDGSSGLYQFAASEVSDKPFPVEAPKKTTPTLALERSDMPLPVVEIQTNQGTITVELFEDEVPNTVKNFVHVAEQGMYNGTLFHRVIKGFMVQGGDPLSKDPSNGRIGSGGPGWCIKCETDKNTHKHAKGVLSMAHAGKDTGGCQFFINLAPTPHLDGRHTVFGQVTSGLDVLDKIGATKTGAGDRPSPDIKIEKVVVKSKREHDYTPDKLPGR